MPLTLSLGRGRGGSALKAKRGSRGGEAEWFWGSESGWLSRREQVGRRGSWKSKGL